MKLTDRTGNEDNAIHLNFDCRDASDGTREIFLVDDEGNPTSDVERIVGRSGDEMVDWDLSNYCEASVRVKVDLGSHSPCPVNFLTGFCHSEYRTIAPFQDGTPGKAKLPPTAIIEHRPTFGQDQYDYDIWAEGGR